VVSHPILGIHRSRTSTCSWCAPVMVQIALLRGAVFTHSISGQHGTAGSRLMGLLSVNGASQELASTRRIALIARTTDGPGPRRSWTIARTVDRHSREQRSSQATWECRVSAKRGSLDVRKSLLVPDSACHVYNYTEP